LLLLISCTSPAERHVWAQEQHNDSGHVVTSKQEPAQPTPAAKTNGADAAPSPMIPSGSAPVPAEPEAHTFWRSGLSGVTGARNVWWGWVIMIVLFLWWMGSSVHFVPAKMAEKYKEMQVPHESVGPASFVSGMIGTGVWYFVFWGLPQGAMQWLIAAAILVVYGAAFSKRTVGEFTRR
jgi:hypothetical protein